MRAVVGLFGIVCFVSDFWGFGCFVLGCVFFLFGVCFVVFVLGWVVVLLLVVVMCWDLWVDLFGICG